MTDAPSASSPSAPSQEMPDLIIHREGKTSLAVPSLDEPKMLPAFFNPRGRFVRDVSMICYDVYTKQMGSGQDRPLKHLTFADCLAGTGARGIRVATEVPSISRVFLNDINSRALEFAKRSAQLNHVEDRCVFSRKEACSFLTSRLENEDGERFDFVDVDPFGTPSDFVDCAIRSVRDGGLLSVTGTDSAVLCGVYPDVAQRKYLGLSLRTDYCHEVGMRLLFGLASQTAMRFESGIEPVFCHHDMHYFRAYFSVRVGNSYSRQNENQIGFIIHCFNCGHRSVVSRKDFFTSRNNETFAVSKRTEDESSVRRRDYGSARMICPSCEQGSEKKGGRVAIGGPLWIGKIQSQEFVSGCRRISDLPLFNEELDIPLYYDLNSIQIKNKKESGKKSVGMPKIQAVLEKLSSSGFLASRTRLNPNSLRTDAPIRVLQSAVAELAR